MPGDRLDLTHAPLLNVAELAENTPVVIAHSIGRWEPGNQKPTVNLNLQWIGVLHRN
jgi:hypothetical protein